MTTNNILRREDAYSRKAGHHPLLTMALIIAWVITLLTGFFSMLNLLIPSDSNFNDMVFFLKYEGILPNAWNIPYNCNYFLPVLILSSGFNIFIFYQVIKNNSKKTERKSESELLKRAMLERKQHLVIQWKYSQVLWEGFAKKEFKRRRKGKLLICLYILIIFSCILTIIMAAYPEVGIAVTWIFLIIGTGPTRLLYKKYSHFQKFFIYKNHPEIKIFTSGVLINNELIIPFNLSTFTLKELNLNEKYGLPCLHLSIEFTDHSGEITSKYLKDYFLPIPGDGKEEALLLSKNWKELLQSRIRYA